MANLEATAGETIVIVSAPIVRNDPLTDLPVPVDLDLADTHLWLVGRANFQSVPMFELDETAGITLNSPSTTDKNIATALIPGSITEAIERPTALLYDFLLEEPGGDRRTVVDYGILRLRPRIASPA